MIGLVVSTGLLLLSFVRTVVTTLGAVVAAAAAGEAEVATFITGEESPGRPVGAVAWCVTVFASGWAALVLATAVVPPVGLAATTLGCVDTCVGSFFTLTLTAVGAAVVPPAPPAVLPVTPMSILAVVPPVGTPAGTPVDTPEGPPDGAGTTAVLVSFVTGVPV